jgi:glycosyltransferase involved in cell wall biosynthesis
VKVLFLIQGFHIAASRYRVLHYLPYLEKAGIAAEVHPVPKTPGDWARIADTLRRTDALFVQRTRLPLYVLLALRAAKKRLIYDFDDAIMFRNSLAENPYSKRRTMSFRRMLRFADLVIAGNAFLEEEARKYHGNVQVLPTPIDGNRYTPKEHSGTPGGTVTIGWIGDHGSIHYMESYRHIWEALGKRHSNLTLTIICDTFIETEHVRLNRVQWRYDREVEDLKALDIGVMPLFDDLWSRGKCGFKIIQYGGVGIPVVCTPVGINRDVVEDGVNGFWALTDEEWLDRLSLLIEDEAMRARMGEAGRKKIMEQYTVEACAPKLVRWIKGL